MTIRTLDAGNRVAAAHEQLARGSPLLVALSTPMDKQRSMAYRRPRVAAAALGGHKDRLFNIVS